jgi:hypothetical protein
MMEDILKEEDENRIVIADNVAENVVIGSALMIFGLYLSWIIFFYGSVFDGNVFVGLFGGFLFFGGLYILLVKKTIIIDGILQSAVIMGESPLKYIEYIKKIPFSDLKTVEITCNTDCEKCSYDSLMDGSSDSWDVSIIPIDGDSLEIYHGDHKLEAEKIAGKVCKITGKMITHRTNYTPNRGC